MHNDTLNSDPVLDQFTPSLSTKAMPGEGRLVDKYGRRITYVRLSITDRCDFRCTYCMAENMSFLPREEVLGLEECLRLARIFVGLGVSKLRITGGEPLVRKNALWLLQQLGQIEVLKELVLTTNGSQLDKQAQALKEAGVKRLNVSLDSLQPERFKAITCIGNLDQVLRGLQAAREAGFMHTKINTVMMRGINDDEFVPLTRFALQEGLDISFIEEMPLGAIDGRINTYISSEETQTLLVSEVALLPSAKPTGGTTDCRASGHRVQPGAKTLRRDSRRPA